MTTLVTGGSGFVGGHLVQRLAREQIGIRCLVRGTSATTELARLPQVELLRLDLLDASESDLVSAMRGVSCVYHIAALVRARNAEEYQRANVDATLRLYRAFARVAGPGARFVFCSSLAAVGPSRDDRPVDEQTAPAPVSEYGNSKLAAERGLAGLEGPPKTILRPPAVYGPRDKALLPLFKLAAHGIILRMGSSKRRLSLIHVEDLIEAFVRAAGAPDAVGTYFVEDGVPHTMEEVASALEAAVGRKAVRITLPNGAVRVLAAVVEVVARVLHKPPLTTRERSRDLTAPSWICRSDVARKAFGFTPHWKLVEGMAHTAQWYRSEGWL